MRYDPPLHGAEDGKLTPCDVACGNIICCKREGVFFLDEVRNRNRNMEVDSPVNHTMSKPTTAKKKKKGFHSLRPYSCRKSPPKIFKMMETKTTSRARLFTFGRADPSGQDRTQTQNLTPISRSEKKKRYTHTHTHTHTHRDAYLTLESVLYVEYGGKDDMV